MKVLVVDDSLFVRQFIRKKIIDVFPQAQVVFGSSGEEGYMVFKETQPSVIITDLLMPGMNGHEFIKMIRAEDKEVRIFVLTADIQTAVRNEVLNYGVNGFLNKPPSDDKLKIVFDAIREV